MQTVFVGLSGGVDSAVSAHLLKKRGYRVVGAFIKGWEPDFLPCTGAEDKLFAMRVAAHLGIPFVAYNLSKEYERDVAKQFIEAYKAGRTPNPDILCNRVIKFGAFWEKAKADGAGMIATGHYARIVPSAQRSVSGKPGTEHRALATSADVDKDQTYFLWTLTQSDLSHSIFPVGGLEKREVRALAREAGLPNAARKDSQGLCFLGHVDMKEFLKRYIPPTRGFIYETNGKKLGEHEGAWFYTLGQHIAVGGLKERRYVVAKDVAKNELIVSADLLGEHPKKEFSLANVSWISGVPPEGELLARYRYRQPLLSARTEGRRVFFDEPQLIAPGQSVVLYDKKGLICLGGGVLTREL